MSGNDPQSTSDHIQFTFDRPCQNYVNDGRTENCARCGWHHTKHADEPQSDSRCAIRGCRYRGEWRLLGTDEDVWFCRHHRDLIEDDGLELPDA